VYVSEEMDKAYTRVCLRKEFEWVGLIL
jgi:hypothetical protein